LQYRNSISPVYVTGKRKRQILIPCANTIVVQRDMVIANTYNPNHVSDDKLELLQQSIIDNGFAFPIVVIWDDDQQAFVVVDGFHRYLISGPKWLGMTHVPLAVLSHNAAQRMIATWQFNKARGSHEVDLDADLIRALIQQGMDEEQIVNHLGIDLDTVHRYKQLTGIAQLFQGAQYSMSWTMMEVGDNV
ncbi:MAG: chromosome partitioning protein ParB, partial [Hyphomicrobiaceae bacterium]